MTTKYLATAVAAFAAIGAAITSLTFVVPVGPTVTPQIQPVVLGAPLPRDHAAMPTVDQLAGVLSALKDPGVPFASKGNLVEGGAKSPPTTRNVTFVNQGGWTISRASAMAPLQEAGVGV